MGSQAKLLLTLFCGFVIYLSGLSQELQFQHFSSENGLSENVVYSIFQDARGFLWIGTHDGLNRYDGYRFKKFRHLSTDNYSLPDNTINSICEDGLGRLWLATNNGLCWYDDKTGRFHKLLIPGNVKPAVQVIAVNNQEILAQAGLNFFLINTTNHKITTVSCLDESKNYFHSGTPFSLFAKDAKGNIYTGKYCNDKIVVWKYENNSFAEHAGFQINEGLTAYRLRDIHLDRQGNYWFTITGHYPLKIPALSIKPDKDLDFQRAPYNCWQIFEDRDNNIWITTNNGLLFYEKGSLKPVLYQQGSENSISSNDGQTVFQDRSGILWIGTSNGLNKVNLMQRKFRHLSTLSKTDVSIPKDFILGVHTENDDEVRIHYNPGDQVFSRFNFQVKRIRHFKLNNYDYRKYIREVLANNSPELTEDKLTTAEEMLFKYLKSYPTTGSLLVDSRKRLWYAGENTILGLNLWKHWSFNFQLVYAMMRDDEIWMATNGDGLLCFETATQKIKKYQVSTSSKSFISSNDITCFLFEPDGNMWIGTKGGGLNYFNRQMKKFYSYTESDGLCHNSIYSMVKDDKGRLWLGTSNGASCFDPVKKKFRNFFRTDGMINSEFNRYSAAKLKDGTLMMGGMSGIDIFHPDSILGYDRTPVTEISEVKVFDKSIHPYSSHRLTHKENYITIEFAAMDFTASSVTRFRYKLIGADREWNDAGSRNSATYALLPPGKYRFEVIAQTSGSEWSPPASFSFLILKPWYQTWWFYTLCGIVVFVLVYVFFQLRLKQKLSVMQIRNRLHRDLHDDVGATLSSIKAYSEILARNGNDPLLTKLIQQNATEMIDRLDVIAWSTNPNYDNFGSLIAAMLKYARPLTHAHEIDLQFDLKGIDESMILTGEVRHQVLMIFKEAMNNMVKHAKATCCSVILELNHNFIVLEISDNGNGYNHRENQEGSGLKNMRRRTEQVAGKFTVTSESFKGTVISVVIPCSGKLPVYPLKKMFKNK